MNSRKPHKAAMLAAFKWSVRYGSKGWGVMEFWHSLDEYERRMCRDAVEQINAAREEHQEEM